MREEYSAQPDYVAGVVVVVTAAHLFAREPIVSFRFVSNRRSNRQSSSL